MLVAAWQPQAAERLLVQQLLGELAEQAALTMRRAQVPWLAR